ncbi:MULTISPECIES: SCP2 sterol-binding domain-containing protein [unclassified Luteimonas]|uniref:ubiquinone biosynthesis accessory factor UbiJ n=1 Tax=unclassified Luteimonas TaxID=2629088 RepID=UPI0018F0BC5C|nr:MULTISPECIES: SCP2 sterol-binding domain-containing protein [unclassified Luteimonas]MBJ6979845.1 SCP2 sterol-binding domain-containing protein [Luteimonas sp. MC1895]MBJ6985463.1 SCP2 sterol-binding domain-containing protein [Luteimonas sp. MC1750]QQO06048.1 SCP2 sterol-binding domain-containing protein [Luteimonas sp. MC1750]
MASSPFPLSGLKPLAGRALEMALNRALALDDDTRQALSRLDGRRVALHLAAPPLAMSIRVDGEALRVGPADDAAEPDLSVRTTLGGLLGQLRGMLAAGDDSHATPSGRLRIEGDAELARALQRLAQRFDPDWQRPFVAAFGDIVGVQVASALASALKGARRAGSGLAATAAEYVVEESRDVVGRLELEAFHDDVDVLRDDVERMAARVARLAAVAGGAR